LTSTQPEDVVAALTVGLIYAVPGAQVIVTGAGEKLIVARRANEVVITRSPVNVGLGS
jgi:hypothetical protein